jgi:pyruvate-formate lyase-activating enzyme
MFTIAITDNYGNLLGEPGIEALGRRGADISTLNENEMIPVPPGTTLMMLPGRTALGYLRKKKKSKSHQVDIKQVEGEQVFPAAANIPPGYTRTYLPAYKATRKSPVLPMFAYTALGWKGEELYCAAIHTHDDLRWHPSMFDSLELPKKIKLKKKKHPGNRLLDHLAHCSLDYRCYTAQNIFYERWEGGIPTGAACNARCMGCISQSGIPGTPSPQERIAFIPTVDEIVELAVDHLQNPEAIISFGQGCEGEPLTRADLILEAVKKIREQTDKGTINMNTNGSMPGIIEKLLDAGMDSIRVSMNSAVKERYEKYFQPQDFSFEDVVKSVDIGHEKGKFVSINFLYLPGVNDKQEEADEFFNFLKNHPVNMIQFRNLNIDPDYYFKLMDVPQGRIIGTGKFIEQIKKHYPEVKIGNFSIPVKK